MLSAEHLALQSRLVQQLAAVKQKEIDYLLARYQAIGVQAALVTACSMQTLVSLDPANTGDVPPLVTWIFFVSSLWCVLMMLWVILLTLYIGNWAPGLALRGPTGSLSRTFDALVGERNNINHWFVGGIATFVVQTVCSIFVLKDCTDCVSGYGIASTVQAVGGMLYAVWYLRRMRARFFRDDVEDNRASRRVSQGAAPGAAARRPNRLQHREGEPREALLPAGGSHSHTDGETKEVEMRQAPPERLTRCGSVASVAGKRLSTVQGDAGKRLSKLQGAATAAIRLQAIQRGNHARKEADECRSRKSIDMGVGGDSDRSAGDGSDRSASSLPPVRSGAPKPPQATPQKARRGSTQLLDNPIMLAMSNPDAALGPTEPRSAANYNKRAERAGRTRMASAPSASEWEFTGYLYKRVGADNRQAGSWMRALKKGASAAAVNLAVAPSWQLRYFHMANGELSYWISEEDYNDGKPAREVIVLEGCEFLHTACGHFVACPPHPTSLDTTCHALLTLLSLMPRAIPSSPYFP